MTPLPVILIFDIGKTNKKLLLFDRDYQLVHEEEVSIPLTTDEDGVPCDDLAALVDWIKKSTDKIFSNSAWEVRAMNFSTFGASFVHLDKNGQPVAPIYSYLKPIPAELSDRFYDQFGGRRLFSVQTGSPALDMLNSGVQLYWLKKERPQIFQRIHSSLHLPQYLSYLFTGLREADITSVGCHTGLWDVDKRAYHDWLAREKITGLLPSVQGYTRAHRVIYKEKNTMVGIGMHDSSASLLPFTSNSSDDAAILSTGTWNIAMLPSFEGQLTEQDYRRDCLFYFLETDRPVAASRIFLGNEMEFQLRRMAKHFGKTPSEHLTIALDPSLIESMVSRNTDVSMFLPETMSGNGPFPGNAGSRLDLEIFTSFEEAYHKLMLDLSWMQKVSLDLLLMKSPVKRLYVTGGFARNELFMSLMQAFYPGMELLIASVNNGSALGAALAMHDRWNDRVLPSQLVSEERVTPMLSVDLSHYRLSL